MCTQLCQLHVLNIVGYFKSHLSAGKVTVPAFSCILLGTEKEWG